MDKEKIKEMILKLIANQQLINRRKVEETFDENDMIDSAVEVMARGLEDIVEMEDTKDDEYFYRNYFYNIGSPDTFVLKVGFDRNNAGKPVYKSGFSVYMVNYDGDDFHFIPVMRVDLEDPMEDGKVIPHKNEYPADMPLGYDDFFHVMLLCLGVLCVFYDFRCLMIEWLWIKSHQSYHRFVSFQQRQMLCR